MAIDRACTRPASNCTTSNGIWIATLAKNGTTSTAPGESESFEPKLIGFDVWTDVIRQWQLFGGLDGNRQLFRIVRHNRNCRGAGFLERLQRQLERRRKQQPVSSRRALAASGGARPSLVAATVLACLRAQHRHDRIAQNLDHAVDLGLGRDETGAEVVNVAT